MLSPLLDAEQLEPGERSGINSIPSTRPGDCVPYGRRFAATASERVRLQLPPPEMPVGDRPAFVKELVPEAPHRAIAASPSEPSSRLHPAMNLQRGLLRCASGREYMRPGGGCDHALRTPGVRRTAFPRSRSATASNKDKRGGYAGLVKASYRYWL